METRSDLECFNQAINYVETVDKESDIPWPAWFRFDKDMTEQELESELSHLIDPEIDCIGLDDSFIEKLWVNVWAHTTSFLEDEAEQMKAYNTE